MHRFFKETLWNMCDASSVIAQCCSPELYPIKKDLKQIDIFIVPLPWQKSLLPIMPYDIACPVKFLLLL